MVKHTSKKYVPEQGDVVWMNFNPAVGHEQKGKRPAFVVSKKLYNINSSFMIVCPMTSHGKKYPFEVVYEGEKISGFVLSDQIKTVDWENRKIIYAERASESTRKTVMNKIKLLLEVE